MIPTNNVKMPLHLAHQRAGVVQVLTQATISQHVDMVIHGDRLVMILYNGLIHVRYSLKAARLVDELLVVIQMPNASLK